jgi:pyruvate formate lyase activating enzyme
MAVVERDRSFYDASGGGLTVSGGEPFSQAEETAELLALAQERGIHTAVETCGYADWHAMARVLGTVDLWLYDLKALDPAVHRALTGRSNRLILANLRRLLDARARVIVRIPVVPGRNTDDILFSRLVDRGFGGKPPPEIHLLPYHRLGESKYVSLGMRYALGGLDQPSGDWLAALKARLEAQGLKVRISG